MPRQAQFSKSDIVAAAMKILRTQGWRMITARSISKDLSCSVSPLFTAYDSMDEILQDVLAECTRSLNEYLSDVSEYRLSFKEMGLRLYRFSIEEPKLFRALFLRPNADLSIIDKTAMECLKELENEFGFDDKMAADFLEQMRPVIVGVSGLANNDPQNWNEDRVSQILSKQFYAFLLLIKSEQEVIIRNPEKKWKSE